jgi:hypothetical protein
LIQAVKIGDKTGFLITKAGLAIGAALFGALVVSIAIGWAAFNNTHSLNDENRRLVSRLENVVMHQKTQIAEAREANCKLKLYDVLSGRAGTLLFKKAHVINRFFEEGIAHTLEIVESIPAEKNCTGIFVEPRGKKKKQTGGLTPSDIKYANGVLGEILEEPRGFQRRNENKVKKNIERKRNLLHKKKALRKKRVSTHEIPQTQNSAAGSNTITSPPVPVIPVITPAPIPPVVESKHEEKENDQKEKKQEKCAVEIKIGDKNNFNQKLKVCH